MTMLVNRVNFSELISQAEKFVGRFLYALCICWIQANLSPNIWIYRQESSINIDSVVPTFKETSDPIEEVFQMHTDDTIETDYSLIDTEPLDIYSRQTI